MTGDLGSWERFEHPDPWHMPAAYWFWHHLPEEAQIREQVRQMHDAGIHSFQVQARMAYPIEGYLTDEYLAACRIAVEAAAELGMMVGVYDDYNWQTGHAAGRAVAGHDHLRERQLFWSTGVVSEGTVEVAVSGIRSATESLGPAGMAWHYEGSVVEWADWRVEFAIAGEGVHARDAAAQAHLAEVGLSGARAVVEGLPDGTQVTVFLSARCSTSRLVNFVDPEAAARFVAAGYQPFHDALGDHFSSTITYFFFDQPHANYYRWAEHHGNLGSAVPFHESLGEAIRREWPNAYAEVLLALLDGDSVGVKSLRAQFYEFFSARSMEIFLGAMHAWTSGHGVLLSGHEVLAHVGQWNLSGAFDEWDLRVNFGLDYFGVDSYRDLTGVDGQDSVPQLSAKLGDSVARSNGRSGTILEQYYARSHTGSGVYAGHWGLTLEELRAQALRHHILGMRQFLFHGFYQTHGHDDDPRMFSNPRFDFPPGINFEPWFEDYHAAFAIESGRLSEFLDATEPICDVAVLYPLRTVWSDGQGGDHAAQGGAWYEALAVAGYGYHLIDERDLLAAIVEPGGMRLGERVYRALVLPGVVTLASSVSVERIGELASAGVTVVATGSTPAVYQSGEQTAEADWSAIAPLRWFPALADAGELGELLGVPGRDAVTVSSADGSPWWRAGRIGDELRLAILNDTHEPMAVTIAAAGLTGAEEWDAVTASRDPLAFAGARLELVLEPMALRLLVLSPAGAVAPAADAVAEWSSQLELPEGWLLTVPSDAHAHSGEVLAVDTRSGWERQGLPDFSGVARYSIVVELDGSSDLQLELPVVSGAVAVSVNGTAVGRRGWSPYRFEIPAALTSAGANELEIEVASTAANRYYAGTGMREAPERAGLLAPPVLRTRGVR